MYVARACVVTLGLSGPHSSTLHHSHGRPSNIFFFWIPRLTSSRVPSNMPQTPRRTPLTLYSAPIDSPNPCCPSLHAAPTCRTPYAAAQWTRCSIPARASARTRFLNAKPLSHPFMRCAIAHLANQGTRRGHSPHVSMSQRCGPHLRNLSPVHGRENILVIFWGSLWVRSPLPRAQAAH